jgi:hypothetical protein
MTSNSIKGFFNRMSRASTSASLILLKQFLVSFFMTQFSFWKFIHEDTAWYLPFDFVHPFVLLFYYFVYKYRKYLFFCFECMKNSFVKYEHDENSRKNYPFLNRGVFKESWINLRNRK